MLTRVEVKEVMQVLDSFLKIDIKRLPVDMLRLKAWAQSIIVWHLDEQWTALL